MPFGEEYWWGGKKAVAAQTGRSLFFNGTAAGRNMRRTNGAGAATNVNKQTFSVWLRMCADGGGSQNNVFGANQPMFSINPADGTMGYWAYGVGWRWRGYPDVYDPSEWNHVLVSWDSTAVPASAHFRYWINGIEVTQFNPDNRDTPTQAQMVWTTPGQEIALGTYPAVNSGQSFVGYLHYAVLVDGQALDPTAFGFFDSQGKWQPKEYIGSVGNQGFIVNFADDLNLGKDISGHGDFAAVGFSAADAYLDSPQTCYPLLANQGAYFSNYDITRLAATGASATSVYQCDHLIRRGKWYWEVTPSVAQSANATAKIGISNDRQPTAFDGTMVGLQANGQYWDGAASSAYGSAWLAGETIGVEVDLDASPKTIRFFVGGVWGALKPLDNSITGWIPTLMMNGSTTQKPVFNFGAKVFVRTVPTGCKQLYSANQDVSIDPTQYFGILQWTGNGGAQGIGGLKFTPDMVWIVHRNVGEAPMVFDSLRGTGRYFLTNSTAVEVVDATTLTSFAAGGIGLGASALVNKLNDPYIAYCWKKSVAAGFDIITWTGDGSTPRSIPHGLGKQPKLVIVKRRDAAANWPVGGGDILATNLFNFNATTALAANAAMFPSLPTSSNIVIGNDATVNAAGGQYMAYVFAEIPGLSWFGSYTTTGAQAYGLVLGVRPALMLCKPGNAIAWRLSDNKRQAQAGAMFSTNLSAPNPEGLDATGEGIAGGAMPYATSVANKMFTYVWAAALHRNSRASPPGVSP